MELLLVETSRYQGCIPHHYHYGSFEDALKKTLFLVPASTRKMLPHSNGIF